jgi:filamentous hemagglutinin family protein
MNRHGSMNHIYRLVWSEVLNAWIAVAENARGRGKSSSLKLVAAALSLGAVVAQAAPLGGQVAAGTASVTRSGATTTIEQSTPNLSLTWKSFNIAAQETVTFVQPSASAIAVNRIFDTNGTQILGHLNANGQVYLINPNGIVFGAGAQVNVGALVASTLDLHDASLGGNTRSFSGNGSGSIVNRGTLNAADGGYVALLGNHVSNQGAISAPSGTVALGAGSSVTLTFSASSLVRMQVNQSVLNSLAQNGGLIRADGGLVVMSAGAKDALLASVVNNTGVIEARTVHNREGVITLLGGMTAGTVKVAGTLDASAPNGGNGGFIETSAAHVQVANGAKVTTAASSGLTGSWLIDPQDFTIAASGGDITGAALSSTLGSSNVEVQSSAGSTAGSGDVNVDDAVVWSANTTLTLTASNNVNVNASITATGNTAGLAINPNTANGAESASGTGAFNLGSTSITLSGSNPSLVIDNTPYIVINSLGAPGSTTGADLQGMNGNLAGYYALGINIDAVVTSGWNGGAGFEPVGNGSAGFGGTFDGLGHTISGLTINAPASANVGLFGFASSSLIRTSLIRNVGLAGGSVTGSTYVGGLVGHNSGTISASYVTGGVVGIGNYVGGLVGFSDRTISQSYATGSVAGSTMVGGLVGLNYGTVNLSFATGNVNGFVYVGGLAGFSSGAISASHATGAVTAQSTAGGLVGFTTGSITTSYATGAVSGNVQIGGLVGQSVGASISTSYSAGRVTGNGNVGGLIGIDSGSTVTNSYWNVTRSGQATSAGGTGLTDAQMFAAASFAGFNFIGTPSLAGNNWVIVDADGTLNHAGGASGAAFPMLASEYSTSIGNAHQLQLMAMAPAASYTLAGDIDAVATATSTDVWGSSGFVPVGNASRPFTGTFDGAGHTINGLTINRPSRDEVGLFGSTRSSLIRNVGLTAAHVTGRNYVGALAGFDYGGTISNSYATGSVTASDAGGGLAGATITGTIDNSYATSDVNGGTRTGGLVGYEYGGGVGNSYATGNVSGSSYVGGLIGRNDYGVVSNTHATGNVTGTDNYVGGLLGRHFYGPVSNSFATGNVSGASYVGGLVGRHLYGTLANTYATGSVSGTLETGGLAGVSESGTISNSYATGNVTGLEQAGGLVGASTGTISNSYATGNVSGFSYVGGLTGLSLGPIENTYATGRVSGSATVGGLVGDDRGGVANSFWDTTTSAQMTSSGGLGMTTAHMRTQANFDSATAANGNVDPAWDFSNVWTIYDTHTTPLLRSFMTPLTVTANNDSKPYDGTAYSGGNGVTYSTTPNGNLLNAAGFTGTSQGAINPGNYAITSDAYSNQQGYLISFVDGALAVTGTVPVITPPAITPPAIPGAPIGTTSQPLIAVVARLESDVLWFPLGDPPETSDLAASMPPTQRCSSGAGDAALSESVDCAVVNISSGKGPRLQIVNGGMRLPDGMVKVVRANE